MSSIDPTIGNPASECKRAPYGVAWLAFVLILPWLAGCQTGTTGVKDTSRTFRTVVIDAGHGGHDTGARSRWGGLEKNATLDTALRLDPKLRAAGFNTVLTRRGDSFISLGERTAISNRQENSIFVSLHYNDAKVRRAYGVETYYRSKSSQKLAESIQAAMCRLPGVASRGVKTANYWVLRRNEYPAVLIEGGFFSNPREAARCAKPAYREAIAGAIADAIIAVRGPLVPVAPAQPPATAPAPAPAPEIPASAGTPAATR
jgi:N-acetylmuramoyl-L-alanine amidase